MSSTNKSKGIVYTLSAKCRDCYRCVRECPVKAIAVKDGQANVDRERCIACGTCIKECPQGAKRYRDDVEKVRFLLRENKKVLASVAPSFSAVFSSWQADRIPSVLRRLGFKYVSNTSEGAYLITQQFLKKHFKEHRIASACPAVVNYVEKYKPEYVESLMPIVSPMIAHAKLFKEIYGDEVKIVFIGPCVCKKFEASRDEYEGLIDAVLTFQELEEWIKYEGLELSYCDESGFDNKIFMGNAGLFPMPGGMMKTAEVLEENLSTQVIHTSGYDKVIELFNSDIPSECIIEALFCKEGCINGPGINSENNLFKRRKDLLSYYSNKANMTGQIKNLKIDLETKFSKDIAILEKKVDESEVLQILSCTGKEEPDHQLNCGACGYKSCREKAIAVAKGLAEVQMCIPFMRRQAEQRMDKIMETIPYGVVIMDENLSIIGMNPAFRDMFLCSNAILGRRISYLFDSKDYEKIATGTMKKLETLIEFNSNKYHQFLYHLNDEKQYVGIYSKASSVNFDENNYEKLKKSVMEKIIELRDQQINMAHEFAMLLGQNTAKSEEILWRLMNVYEDKGGWRD